MYFNIIGNLIKLDPNRGKMASIVVRDNRRGQHWLIYLDLQHSNFADLVDAKQGCKIEVRGFATQKSGKTFFVAQDVALM